MTSKEKSREASDGGVETNAIENKENAEEEDEEGEDEREQEEEDSSLEHGNVDSVEYLVQYRTITTRRKLREAAKKKQESERRVTIAMSRVRRGADQSTREDLWRNLHDSGKDCCRWRRGGRCKHGCYDSWNNQAGGSTGQERSGTPTRDHGRRTKSTLGKHNRRDNYWGRKR